jgi:hypothetical protein
MPWNYWMKREFLNGKKDLKFLKLLKRAYRFLGCGWFGSIMINDAYMEIHIDKCCTALVDVDAVKLQI